MFETCLWATGGLFAAWSLPHPELEDASQNVTWIVRGIADRSGRVVKLAEPVNRPCIDWVNRWQHEGQIPRSGHRQPIAAFESYLEWLRSPIGYEWDDMGLGWELRPGDRAVDHRLGLSVGGPVRAVRRRCPKRSRMVMDQLSALPRKLVTMVAGTVFWSCRTKTGSSGKPKT